MQIACYLAEPISYMILTYYKQETYVCLYQLNKIIPIFNKRDNKVIDNYRIITIPIAIVKIIKFTIIIHKSCFQNAFCLRILTQTANTFMENMSHRQMC